MSIPTVYTENSLAEYMLQILGTVGEALDADAADFAEAVNEALLAYGQTDISQITGSDNIRKLRCLARLEAWKVAVTETAGDYDFSADGGSYKRSQAHEQAKAMLARAEVEAMEYLPGYEVGSAELTWTQDPYQYRPDDER